MANAKFSTLGAQFTAQASAVATAAGGTVVTSDITALGAILTAISTYNLPLMAQLINSTNGPGGTALTSQLTPG
jgi:hypothetical protein